MIWLVLGGIVWLALGFIAAYARAIADEGDVDGLKFLLRILGGPISWVL